MGRHPSLRGLPWLAVAMLALQGCAITLDKDDVFTLRSPRATAAEVPLEPGLDRARVREIGLDVGPRRFSGYRYAAPEPRRAVLFFPGNGYGAPEALSRVAGTFSDAHTDVYVVSYGLQGEAVPEVAQVFAMGRGLAALAAATSGVPPSKVAAIGHSLGGWVTLHLAGTEGIGCAVVAGTGTDAAETAAGLVPWPLSWVASFRPTADVALLDNPALARAARVPTLVVASEADDVMPPPRSRAVFGQLRPGGGHEFLLVPGARHGGYFRDADVTAAMRAFIASRC